MNRRGFFGFLAGAAAAVGLGKRAALASTRLTFPERVFIGIVPAAPGGDRVVFTRLLSSGRLDVLEEGAAKLRVFGAALEPLGASTTAEAAS